MNKITLYALAGLFALLPGISCKKGEKSPGDIQKETPFKASIESKTPASEKKSRNEGAYDFGNKFYVTIDGKITQLGCRMPVSGTYTVTL